MSSKDKQEFKATQKRISALKSYLRSDWNVLYYNTDISNYFALFEQQQALLDQGKEVVVIDGQEISVYDLDTWFDLVYKKPYVQKLTDRIQTKIEKNVVVKKYLKWREQYFTLLEKRSI